MVTELPQSISFRISHCLFFYGNVSGKSIRCAVQPYFDGNDATRVACLFEKRMI